MTTTLSLMTHSLMTMTTTYDSHSHRHLLLPPPTCRARAVCVMAVSDKRPAVQEAARRGLDPSQFHKTGEGERERLCICYIYIQLCHVQSAKLAHQTPTHSHTPHPLPPHLRQYHPSTHPPPPPSPQAPPPPPPLLTSSTAWHHTPHPCPETQTPHPTPHCHPSRCKRWCL